MISFKTLLTFILVQLLSSFSFSQTNSTFKIISSGNITNVADYEVAIRKADMESYRYRSQNDTLSFDNGLKFILFSAEDLRDKGVSIDLNNYKNPEEIDKEYINPIFSLTPDGWLIALYQRWDKE